jgi:hypothetical protein
MIRQTLRVEIAQSEKEQAAEKVEVEFFYFWSVVDAR